MKTIFVVNPKAGKGKKIDELIKRIKTVSAELSADTEIYYTKAVGDATRFVKEYYREYGTARFIACGGDGTINEVAGGVIACDGCEMGAVPIGTGNDFCRNFVGVDFSDIKGQIYGESMKCDAIKYTTSVDGEEKVGYTVNMVNIGFDCNVADLIADIKEKTFFSGSMTYFLSILINLIKKKGADLEVIIDGEVRHKGALLLTALANGAFCGGGVNSNPKATINDGLIDINIIKDITRSRFITLLPHYMKGTFLGLKNIDKYIISQKGKKVTIVPNPEKIRISSDGEIYDVCKTDFEIVQSAFSFVIPSSDVLGKRENVEICYSN